MIVPISIGKPTFCWWIWDHSSIKSINEIIIILGKFTSFPFYWTIGVVSSNSTAGLSGGIYSNIQLVFKRPLIAFKVGFRVYIWDTEINDDHQSSSYHNKPTDTINYQKKNWKNMISSCFSSLNLIQPNNLQKSLLSLSSQKSGHSFK